MKMNVHCTITKFTDWPFKCMEIEPTAKIEIAR